MPYVTERNNLIKGATGLRGKEISSYIQAQLGDIPKYRKNELIADIEKEQRRAKGN